MPRGPKGDMNKIGSVLIALILVAPLTEPSPIAAEGAFAIGSTGDIVKDGIALGLSVNQPTKEAAAAAALKDCRAYTAARKAAARCKVIDTFKGKCFATAFDPKPLTPGAGWAIGPDMATAKARALAACQATAGTDRREFCIFMTVVATPTSTAATGSATACDTHN
jgi:Domain of unknown function (DUF4189)